MNDGKLTIAPMAGEQTLVASDRFGNSTTVKFTVNTEHTADEGVITTPATAATEGVKTYTCTICGTTIRTEAVAKLAPTTEEGTNGTDRAPHTGDTNHMMYWLALLVVSGLGMMLTVISRKKR